MFRRPVVMRRGPGLLGAAAIGGVAYAAGRHGANRQWEEQQQDEQIADVQAQQAPPQQPMSSEERISQLQELGRLKASGVLTEEEFQNEKRRILGG